MMRKWNFKTRKYEPYSVPEKWKCPIWTDDMDEIVNCPSCGKVMTYGQGYISSQIHNEHGLGYSVCGDCYEKEWAAEKAAMKR